MAGYVLDTSAVLAVLFHEPGAERVLQIIEGEQPALPTDLSPVSLPFVALMEIEYWLIRRLSQSRTQAALLLLDNWPVQVEESTPAWRHEAARIKATTPLSLADSWIAALALTRGATLVHKDPEYDQLSSLLVERLPYKSRRS
jgi:predicted nucleic acid-binding protein